MNHDRLASFLAHKGLSLRKMDDGHYVDGFSCGRDDKMDRWFCETALKWQHEGMCAVWVLSPADNDTKALGFFTLSAHQIIPSNVSRKDKAFYSSNKSWVNNLSHPFPAQLLGKFALDQDCQGKNFGQILMLCAYDKYVKSADVVGAKFLVLDVQDDVLVRYYREQYDFVRSGRSGSGAQMYRPTLAIREDLDSAFNRSELFG